MPKPLQHEDRIQLALEALRSGQIKIIRNAADAFGVPKSTLHRRVKGGGTRQEAQVKNRKLRPTEEAALIQWDRVIGTTVGCRRRSVISDRWLTFFSASVEGFTLLDASQLTSTPVPAMTVGENWVQRLLHRHPHLETKYSRKYDYQRALCEDPEKISAWFARVQRTINEYGVLDSDIYNFDETGFQMGVASTSKVVTRSDRRNRPVVIQPGNREWTTVIECINASGWSVDPMIIFEGKVHISSWYDGSVLPKTWRIGVSDNGWTTDELTFEWLREVFEPQTRKRTVGRYRLLILDGHGSHSTPAFDKFCTEHRILTECMPPHSSHYLQPLDVSCFAVLKRTYGDLVKAKIALGVHHIDKPRFLELFLEARKKTFNTKNIASGFRAAGLLPFDPTQVLCRLQTRIRTPSPPPTPIQPPSLPLKTPANIVELDSLQRKHQREIIPTDQALQKIIKGCQMAMHNATLLQEENSRLRAENGRQKRKRARRAFIQTGGTMTIGEGMTHIEASQNARQKGQGSQEARREVEEGEVGPSDTTAPKARKRAQPKCSWIPDLMKPRTSSFSGLSPYNFAPLCCGCSLVCVELGHAYSKLSKHAGLASGQVVVRTWAVPALHHAIRRAVDRMAGSLRLRLRLQSSRYTYHAMNRNPAPTFACKDTRVKKEWPGDSRRAADALICDYMDESDIKMITAVYENIVAAVKGETTILEYKIRDDLLNKHYKYCLDAEAANRCLAAMAQQTTDRYPHARISKSTPGTSSATIKRVLEAISDRISSPAGISYCWSSQTRWLWSSMIFGAAPEWWLGVDNARELAPIASPSPRHSALRKAGFAGVDAITAGSTAWLRRPRFWRLRHLDGRARFLRRLLAAPASSQPLPPPPPIVESLVFAGFADDTNLLVFGRNPEANVRQLEAAWETWEAPAPLNQKGLPGSWESGWTGNSTGKAHLVAVEKKLRTPELCPVEDRGKDMGDGASQSARSVHKVHPVGAGLWRIIVSHPHGCGEGEPAKKGITKALGKAQNKSLRIVADFENRLQRPDLDDGRGGKKTAASVVLTACRKIQQRLSSRRGNRGRPRTLGPQGPTAVERAAGTETLFRNETLRRHDGLSKAKSSLLIQIRTGAIGLRDFLFTRGVPEVLTPACECGEGRETAEHLVVWCLAPPLTRRWERTGIRTRRDFYSVLHGINPTTARLARRVLDWADGLGEAADVQLSQEARAGSGGLKRPRSEARRPPLFVYVGSLKRIAP
ncbi:hypothetical protein CHGG_02130 [Chaetomium globosum CBS 148.51]|uniref:HTH CENPB-type domain-containing protein n=1 Tax=Chaetomium globosum (strain ATCC 6205 / CBS 148.51 / DSM 1962 / NBRC 6347 / NRRL 1970) TaxID=306901 RepID=Q2HCC4_CHAGB|nr:uncharacterized protein CHGG_02130 [Chaetomium globosum CBS 148.51]EAQ93895.1 hypothetical protein CHGG_02130 [Chaetomium globosum CBS 148.51]